MQDPVHGFVLKPPGDTIMPRPREHAIVQGSKVARRGKEINRDPLLSGNLTQPVKMAR